MMLMATSALLSAGLLTACRGRVAYTGPEDYPVRKGSLSEMDYTPRSTEFHLWSPAAEEVQVQLYETGAGGDAFETHAMAPGRDGTWHVRVKGDLQGKYYTFNVEKGRLLAGRDPGHLRQGGGHRRAARRHPRPLRHGS